MREFLIAEDAPRDPGSDGRTVLISVDGGQWGCFYWDYRYSALTLSGALRFENLKMDLADCEEASRAEPSLGVEADRQLVTATIITESSGDDDNILSLDFRDPRDKLRFDSLIADPSPIEFARFDFQPTSGRLSDEASIPFSVASDASKFSDAQLTVRLPASLDWTASLIRWLDGHGRNNPASADDNLHVDLNNLKSSRQPIAKRFFSPL